MKYYTFNSIELTEMVNHALDIWLHSAFEDGILTTELIDRLATMRVVMSDKPKLFSTLYSKFLRKGTDELRVEVVYVRENQDTISSQSKGWSCIPVSKKDV